MSNQVYEQGFLDKIAQQNMDPTQERQFRYWLENLRRQGARTPQPVQVPPQTPYAPSMRTPQQTWAGLQNRANQNRQVGSVMAQIPREMQGRQMAQTPQVSVQMPLPAPVQQQPASAPVAQTVQVAGNSAGGVPFANAPWRQEKDMNAWRAQKQQQLANEIHPPSVPGVTEDSDGTLHRIAANGMRQDYGPNSTLRTPGAQHTDRELLMRQLHPETAVARNEPQASITLPGMGTIQAQGQGGDRFNMKQIAQQARPYQNQQQPMLAAKDRGVFVGGKKWSPGQSTGQKLAEVGMNKEYAQGFMDKCAELGVDAEKLAALPGIGDLGGMNMQLQQGIGRRFGAQFAGQLGTPGTKPPMPAPGAQQFANAPWRRTQMPGMRPSAVGAMQNAMPQGALKMIDNQGSTIGQGNILAAPGASAKPPPWFSAMQKRM